MITRVQQFLALQACQRRVFMRAWCMLGWYRLALEFLPLKHFTGSLGRDGQTGAIPALSAGQLEEARMIGWLVAAAARVTPWESRCLHQVLVTRRHLASRGIGGQICLGFNPGSVCSRETVALAAHAWLRCDGEVVNGGAGHRDYTVISVISWEGSCSGDPSHRVLN